MTCQEENPVVCTAEQGRTGECRGNGCRDSFEDCLEDVPLPGETRVQEQGGFFRNFIVNLFGGEEEEFSEYGYEEEVDDSVYEEDYEEEEMDEGEEMALDLENLVISWDQECMASARDSFGLCLEMCFYRDECELECHIAFEISLDSCRDDPKPPYEPPQDPQPPQEPPQDCASAAKSSFNLCLEMCDNRKCTDACRDEWESKCHKEFEIELGNCRSDPEPPQKPTPPQDPQPPYEPPQDPSSPQGCAADARSSFNMCLEMCSYDDQCAKCHLEFETALDNCRSDPEPPQDPIGPLGNPDDGDDDFMSCQKSCSLAQDYCAGKCREYVNPEDCLGNCNYNAVGCYENCDDQQNHWETLNFFEKIIDEILDFSWFEEELPLEDFEGQSCESIDWSDGCVLNDEGWGLTSGSPDSDSNCVHDIEDCCPDDPNFGIGSCEGSEEGDYYSYSYENSWNCQEESENHLAGCFEDCSNNVCSDSCIVTFQTDFEECGGSMGVRSYDDWVNPDDSNKESDCVAECWPDSHECRQGCLASCRNPEISCNWDEVNQCTQTCFDGGEGYNSCMDNCMGDDDDIIGRL